MPRLPTILVIGSQAISTTPASSTVVIAFPSQWYPRPSSAGICGRPLSPALLVTGQELVALLAPLRFLVRGLRGEPAERADDRSVQRARGRRHSGTWRLVHEGHELVREPRHGAGNADAADVRAAAHAVDPAALGDVALHYRPPAAQLHQALRRAVLGRELALLVIATSVAALVHGRAEQPGRAERLVQRDHRRLAGDLVEQVQDRLGPG